MGQLKITLRRSPAGRHDNQIDTVRSLGLRRLNHTVVQADTPSVRGMVQTVAHLVQVEEVA